MLPINFPKRQIVSLINVTFITSGKLPKTDYHPQVLFLPHRTLSENPPSHTASLIPRLASLWFAPNNAHITYCQTVKASNSI